MHICIYVFSYTLIYELSRYIHTLTYTHTHAYTYVVWDKAKHTGGAVHQIVSAFPPWNPLLGLII